MEWTGVVFVKGKKPFPNCVINPRECRYNPLAGCDNCKKGVYAISFGNDKFKSSSRRLNPDF